MITVNRTSIGLGILAHGANPKPALWICAAIIGASHWVVSFQITDFCLSFCDQIKAEQLAF